jgi:hypothetical protein
MPRYIRVSDCPNRDLNGKCVIKPFCRYTANKALINCQEGMDALKGMVYQNGFMCKPAEVKQ